MSRYRRRSPVRRTKVSSASPFKFTPIGAFLLIAAFGFLLTGCKSVHGPDAQQLQQDTFTADDVAKFQQLSGDSSSPASASGSLQAVSSVPAPSMIIASSGSEAIAASVADPALAKRYESVRGGTAAGGTAYRVINTFLNVRDKPLQNGAFVEKLDQGAVVQLAEFMNAGWAKIKTASGKEGYVSARYIAKLSTDASLEQDKKAFSNLYFVNYKFVNVRAKTDVSSEKLGTIDSQEFVRPLSVNADWAKISYQGKEGYVSMQFLAKFTPQFITRQEQYTLPVLRYDMTDPAMLTLLVQHAQALKAGGAKLITLRNLFDLILVQETRDQRLQPKSVVFAVQGITAANVKKVSDTLSQNGIPATLFIETRQVGVSGITEKALQTLQANGFDIESAGHTGDDLRGLTNAQVQLEMLQSRALLEEMTHKTVFALAYPQGGVNDRIVQKLIETGYLLGLTGVPDKTFSRDQFARMPSYVVAGTMSADDVANLIK
jgi:uncharacterized protein YgiM (DUF1202 family)